MSFSPLTFHRYAPGRYKIRKRGESIGGTEVGRILRIAQTGKIPAYYVAYFYRARKHRNIGAFRSVREAEAGALAAFPKEYP